MAISIISFFNSRVGILEYIFLMSKEHSLVFSDILMFCRSSIKLIVLCMLKVFGSLHLLFKMFLYSFANLYIGAFWKLTVGLMGLPVLCNFIKALICGGFGF
jgi:hypothetical protein